MHRTRYHGPGSWPPKIEAILADLLELHERRGFVSGGKEIRGLCMRADKRTTKGAADEILRFLENVGVIITCRVDDKRKLLIDPEAITRVRECVENDTAPLNPQQSEIKLRRAELLRALAKPERPATPDRLATPAEKAIVATARPVVIEAPPKPPEQSAPPPRRETQKAQQPIKEEAVTRQEVTFHYAMFLPEGALLEVWTYLFVSWRELQNGEVRVAIPNDRVPNGVECDRVEFDSALERFVRAGVVVEVDESGGDNTAYEFRTPPNSIHMIEISHRKRVQVPAVWLGVADRARKWFAANAANLTKQNKELEEWLRAHCPEVNSRTAMVKLVGYEPERRETERWGIFVPNPQMRGVYLPTLMGFEPYELVGVERDPSHRGRPAKSLSPLVATQVGLSNAINEPEESAPSPAQPVLTPTEMRPAAQGDRVSALLAHVQREQDRLGNVVTALTALVAVQTRSDELSAELEKLKDDINALLRQLAGLGITL